VAGRAVGRHCTGQVPSLRWRYAGHRPAGNASRDPRDLLRLCAHPARVQRGVQGRASLGVATLPLVAADSSPRPAVVPRGTRGALRASRSPRYWAGAWVGRGHPELPSAAPRTLNQGCSPTWGRRARSGDMQGELYSVPTRSGRALSGARAGGFGPRSSRHDRCSTWNAHAVAGALPGGARRTPGQQGPRATRTLWARVAVQAAR
jgi:hypothetical protein